ncbi:hypothetical protein PVK06_007560 [Gossypium arboreum]|uniref:DUF4218 domain-containing protein n=1 Tax=Gossypium arboreum TaxID=29729 RepID=A0ABR0QIF5_GOSAR|nr:hypothetical protein PVK06_007560 [Gossypium arboreum]
MEPLLWNIPGLVIDKLWGDHVDLNGMHKDVLCNNIYLNELDNMFDLGTLGKSRNGLKRCAVLPDFAEPLFAGESGVDQVRFIKSYCRNKRYPEGSIAEGYLAEECMTFCSRYLEDAETRLNRPSRNAGLNDNDLAETYLFQSYGEPIGKVEIVELDDISWIQAHRYVLFNHDSIEPLRNEYKQILRSRARSRRLQHREINKLFTESFHEWLSQTVWSGKDVNDEVKWISQGPNRVIKRYSAFLINGYRFHTKYRERMRRTQNCGVVVNSSITSYASARDSNPVEGNVEYYGLLTDIIELD